MLFQYVHNPTAILAIAKSKMFALTGSLTNSIASSHIKALLLIQVQTLQLMQLRKVHGAEVVVAQISILN